jgi:hypothetical protein
VSALLETLADNIRREVIHYFENFTSDEVASLGTIVSHIEARVPNVDDTELRVSLRHIHLPKLEQRGWIEYDERTNDIRYCGHEQADELLAELIDVFDG